VASARLAAPGTVMLSFKLSVGKVGIARVPMYTNEAIAALPIRQPGRLDPEYLAFVLASLDLMQNTDRAAMGATLNKAKLRAISIPLPPLDEQRRIAAILDEADALRTNRREAIDHFDGLARAIFNDMFGDAQDWTIAALGELVPAGDRINYGVVQPGGDVAGGVPLIRVSDIRSGRVDRTRLKLIDPTIERRYSRSRIRGNEVLITCVGSPGVIAVVRDEDIGSNVARAVTRVPIENPATRAYVAQHLRSATVQRYFENELRTVSQPTLNGKQIVETKVPVPPLALQEEFARASRRVEMAMGLRERELELADRLFVSLEDRAFKGEL
jgi:type I restriction enzyme S subunit